jgi:hypothetical protein
MKKLVLGLAMIFALTTVGFAQEIIGKSQTTNFNITEEMVVNTQKAWAQSLLQISKTYLDKGDYKKVANEVLDKGYNYENGIVLFKPTLTTGDQIFRMDREGALAYFIGGNPKYPNDTGFALKGWVKYGIANKGIILNGSTAISMGQIILTDNKGNTVVVDKTWGFKMNELGDLKIILHHSSLPYVPAKTAAVTTKEVVNKSTAKAKTNKK